MAEERNESVDASGLVGVNGACLFLDVSRPTVYRLMKTGELPSCVIGRTRKISKKALIEYAKSLMAKT